MSKERELRRAEAQRTLAIDRAETAEQLVDDLKKRIAQLEKEKEGMERAHAHQVHGLRGDVASERLRRVVAQRGLIDEYHQPCVACGQKWWSGEIGYDPDHDPDVQREIAEGLLPPRHDPQVISHIAAEIVAGKTAS
jgi:hypothetical protein